MGIFDDGIGGFISGLFGSKNKNTAQGYEVDPNAYEYGGRPGGAEAAANEMRGLGNIQRAQGDQFTGIAANQFNRGNALLNQSQGARDAQWGVANQFMDRANGNNLIANMVGDRARRQAIAANASSAASARGPAGLALAQQNEMNQNANAAGQIGEAQMIQGANESLQNLNAAAGQFGNIRAGDIGAAQTSYGAAGTAGGIGLGHGQLGLGYTGQQNQINAQQLASQQNREAQKSANALGQQGINAGVGGQNAGMNQQNAWGLANMGGTVAMGAAGGGGGGGPPKPAAEGGPMEARTPYLVGERGPELIIPAHDGQVIPADETRALLSRAAPRAGGGGIQAGGQLTDAQAAQIGAQGDEYIAALRQAAQKPTSITYPDGHQVPAAPPQMPAPAPAPGAEERALQREYVSQEQNPRPTWGTATSAPAPAPREIGKGPDMPGPSVPEGEPRSTWGTGPTEAEVDARNIEEKRKAIQKGLDIANEPSKVDQKNENTIKGYERLRALGFDLSPEDEREARRILGGASFDRKQATQAAAKRAGLTPAKIAGALGSAFDPGKLSGGSGGAGMPTHAGYVPPQLLSVAAAPRAFGGPILQGGQPMAAPWAGTFDQLNGGGMNVMGSLKQHAGMGTQFIGAPVAREEGGPVKAFGENVKPVTGDIIGTQAGTETTTGRTGTDEAATGNRERAYVVLDGMKDNARAAPAQETSPQAVARFVYGLQGGGLGTYAQAVDAATKADPRDAGEAAVDMATVMGGAPAQAGAAAGGAYEPRRLATVLAPATALASLFRRKK